jgi:CRISPR-associated exonuclease Cas4
LWLFAKNIKWEDTSEDVRIGKIISEYTYERKKHEIHLFGEEGELVIDFIDKKRKIVHEVKKSNKMEELHIWQLKYYLYELEQSGIYGFTGEIDYPKQKRLIKVELSEEDRVKIRDSIKEIEKILSSKIAPLPINKPYCKKCSYYEFCYC